MKRSKSIVGIAVGVSSIVLIVAGVIAHRSVQILADTSDEVVRSKELELSLERLLSSVRDAETGQRGYIVTGSEDYLFPYDKALSEIESRLRTVDARMQARDGSVDELQSLRGLVTVKLEELARSIELQRSGHRDEAIALVRSNAGKSAMDAIRALIGERVLVEQRNVERLMALERDARQATLRSSISVSVLAVLLMMRARLRGTARLRTPAAQRRAAGDDVAQHRRRGDRDGRARQGDHDQSDRRKAHRLASARCQGQAARRDFPHRQRADSRDGGEPGGQGAARRRHRRARESHRADPPGGP